MTTIDLNNLSPEQLLELSKEVVAKTRAIKNEQKKKEKFGHLEPHYSEYRLAVKEAKQAVDKKKSLLKKLKELGFGKTSKSSTTPKKTGKKK